MSAKDIAKAFKSASRKACKQALSSGRPVVVKQGRRIVSLSKGGKSQTVQTLDKAYVRSNTKSYKLK